VGLPGGVVNVITARSSGRTMEPLIKDPRTRKLSFTGSTEVGRTLIQQSADQVLRVSMELGGNAPFLIFDDADVDAAVEGGLVAYVYTQDINRAFKVIEGLDTGMIGLNQGMVSNAGAPFGGVKQSGFGREGGPEGINEYLETKYVAMNVP